MKYPELAEKGNIAFKIVDNFQVFLTYVILPCSKR